MVTTVEIFKGKDGWYFRTRGRNGKIGDRSEAYTRKTSAVRAAKRWHPSTPIVLVAR